MTTLLLRVFIVISAIVPLAMLIDRVLPAHAPRTRDRVWACTCAVILIASLGPGQRLTTVDLPTPAFLADALRYLGVPTSGALAHGESLDGTGRVARRPLAGAHTRRVTITHTHTPVALATLGLWAVGAFLISAFFVLHALRTWRWAARLPLADSRFHARHALPSAAKYSVHLAPDHDRRAPCLTGLLRPRIVLPRGLLDDDATLAVVLQHEIAHAERHDLWIERGWQLLLIIAWWHPFAWYGRRRTIEARELAADAAVLARGITPVSCFDALVTVYRRGPAAGGTAMAGPDLFRRRLLALGAPTGSTVTEPAWPRRALTATALTLAVALATVSPAITVPSPTRTAAFTADDLPRVETGAMSTDQPR